MKLLNRTSRYYLFFSLLIFAIIGLALFFALRYTLDHSTDDSLEHTRPALARELLQLKELEPTMYIMDEIVEVRPILQVSDREFFRDTTIMVVEDNGALEPEPFRKYTYEELVDGKPYQVSISLSTVENEDLIRTLLLVVLGGLLLFLLAINLLNRYLSRELWRPFYQTLAQIKDFSIQKDKAPSFSHSDTTEFEDLNRSVEGMTGQLIKEYNTLRRFTENASHELQTPLAIIRNQIDLLLREGERSEQDYNIIQQVSEAVSRLGKLNQSLLLLTKIERGQVPEAEWIDLNPLIERKLEQLVPGLEARGISLHRELAPRSVRMPLMLADILLNNLIGNAIRHNVDGGDLSIRLADDFLVIENTGPPLRQAPELLFERFRKESKSAESLGLGLAIVREICDKYNYNLRYTSEAGRHRMTVAFG
ncbi:sensor histidine kinase [Neolewinella persica]|uniref:sensor histidine kinase n=1 Tax=Neolewinella persica TaxID=70998 RepID=UPI00037C70DB|nr:HAMP domain-containing sensor histidine kinase [Neolewinella persica]